jgi:phosphoglycolate phosphatase
MIRAAVFDFDGTLTPSTLDFRAMREDLDRLICDHIGDAAIDAHRGLLMLERISAVEAELGRGGVAFRKKALALLQKAEVAAAEGQDVFPFARAVLRAVARTGVAIGIMTRNCTAAVRKAFPDLDTYVRVMVTREDVRLVKPDPAHPRAVLDQLAVAPYEAVVVGDHPTDIVAGVALGARTVGVLTGRTTEGDLWGAGADFVMEDIRGLPTIIRTMEAVSTG